MAGSADSSAGQQVPVGVGARRVRATGAHQLDGVAGFGRCGPRTGHALVAVMDEIDGELLRRRVHFAHGVGAHGLAVHAREHELDVGVGEVVGPEGLETRTAEPNPDEVVGQPDRVLDHQFRACACQGTTSNIRLT